MEDVKEKELSHDAPKEQIDRDTPVGDEKSSYASEDHPMPSSEQEEEVIRKKYGGLMPRKHPLISKDHERAFFDSADWALGKQGAQKPKGPLEALRPKLQPTPHQQVRARRPSYASGDNALDYEIDKIVSPDDQSSASAGDANSFQDYGNDCDIKSNVTAEKHSERVL